MNNARLYRKWIEEHELAEHAVKTARRGRTSWIAVPLPGHDGLFRRGTIACALPYLRVYWNVSEAGEDMEGEDARVEPEEGAREDAEAGGPESEVGARRRPRWQPDTWVHLPCSRACELRDLAANPSTDWSTTRFAKSVKSAKRARRLAADLDSRSGFVRFMRADQALECARFHVGDDLDALVLAIRDMLGAWLIPLDEPLRDRPESLDRRIETVRLIERGDAAPKWSRQVGFFPDDLRTALPDGVDPVHTPENARAGLTRHLCQGWTIDDDGKLVAESKDRWGPSTAVIPHRLHDAPRRLMLGASLQTRAAQIVEPETPASVGESKSWLPPGRNLRVAFEARGGWTHEDGIVLSETGASKLSRHLTRQVRVLVPSIAARFQLLVPDDKPVAVKHGQILARAFIDAYALGLRRHEIERLLGDRSEVEKLLPEELRRAGGWVEVALPAAVAPFDGELRRVAYQDVGTTRWRGVYTFDFERSAVPIRIGDKLATRHGIKGVVSQILPDAEMPLVGTERADIVLSPLGIVRRGAMGQLREAAAAGDELPRGGTIFVMRQPQDAALPERCRVRGPEKRDDDRLHHGQRYGEMEFWALMAHGAPEIAMELLSVERSTAPWMKWEAEIQKGGHRDLATRALNRYLAVAGVQIRDGRLRRGLAPRGTFDLVKRDSSVDFRVLRDIETKLENSRFFCDQGGLGKLPIERPRRGGPIRVKLDERWEFPRGLPDELDVGKHYLTEERVRGKAQPTTRVFEKVQIADGVAAVLELKGSGGERRVPRFLEVEQVYILPPWLRPSSPGQMNDITRAYRRLLRTLMFEKSNREKVALAVSDCVRLALHEDLGAGGFLRREVLGRRLTRSARAVIVPRPDLRIDQIAIPQWIADRLFQDLPDENRRLVLVNRNPTLHRRGLLALRPVIERSESAANVFGLPLGILRAMNADFDGDQASVVALESQAALDAAERLVPGAKGLREDPFRPGKPAFPFAKELDDLVAAERYPSGETHLARLIADRSSTQDAWCAAHLGLQQRLLARLGDGWNHPAIVDSPPSDDHDFRDLWKGLGEDEWRAFAMREMEKVHRGVRRKGQIGGILRRELYRRAYMSDDAFWLAVEAAQAVTERMTQTALSVKTGAGATTFDAATFFDDPTAPRSHELIRSLDKTVGASLLGGALGRPTPAGSLGSLLAWIARPTATTLVASIEGRPSKDPVRDPRIAWFLA